MWTLVQFFSSLNPLMRFFKQFAVVKVFSNSKHMYSLTPVCIFWCIFKLCRCEKLFPHKLHECGFSFVWTLRWFFRFEALKNVLSHWSRVQLLSSVNVHVILKVWWKWETLQHWSQVCGFSRVWTLMCFQTWWHTESLVTVWTLVRFLSSVNHLMCSSFKFYLSHTRLYRDCITSSEMRVGSAPWTVQILKNTTQGKYT